MPPARVLKLKLALAAVLCVLLASPAAAARSATRAGGDSAATAGPDASDGDSFVPPRLIAFEFPASPQGGQVSLPLVYTFAPLPADVAGNATAVAGLMLLPVYMQASDAGACRTTCRTVCRTIA